MTLKSKTLAKMRSDAVGIFEKALQAVDPQLAVKRYCRLENEYFLIGDRRYDLNHYDNIIVIGAGKATAPMAAALEDILDKRISSGVIVVKYDHSVDLKQVKIVEAGHPLPTTWSEFYTECRKGTGEE
jgi:hydroxypyruvate reductase